MVCIAFCTHVASVYGRLMIKFYVWVLSDNQFIKG